MRPFVIVLAVAVACLVPAAPAQAPTDPTTLVDYWYQTFLRRTSTTDGGAPTWVALLQQGHSPDEVLSGILGSEEYYQRGGGTPAGFVTVLFADNLHRPPTVAETNYWVSRLYTAGRQQVALEVLTQHPGVWVGKVVAPERHYDTDRDHWQRDRRPEVERQKETHDYRRPEYPFPHKK
jgi:hypothetical protein